MGFWSAITGTASNEEQQAQLAEKQNEYLKALERRKDEGTLAPTAYEKGLDYIKGVTLEDSEKAASTEFYNTIYDETGSVGSGIVGTLKSFFAGLGAAAGTVIIAALILWYLAKKK